MLPSSPASPRLTLECVGNVCYGPRDQAAGSLRTSNLPTSEHGLPSEKMLIFMRTQCVNSTSFRVNAHMLIIYGT